MNRAWFRTAKALWTLSEILEAAGDWAEDHAVVVREHREPLGAHVRARRHGYRLHMAKVLRERDEARLDASINLDLYRQARDRWLREPQEEKA